MGFFKHSFALPKKVLALLLALMITVPLVLIKTSAGEHNIAESIGQSAVVDDKAQEQTPAGNPGIDENGEQADDAEETEAAGAGTYANSVSGMLWLDMYEDIDNGIYAGDGTRQKDESPLAGYTVSLFKADDRSAAVQERATGGDGRYEFTNIDPGVYVVGIASTAIDGIEYLLPFYYLDGTEGDNRLVAAYDAEKDAYLYAYTGSIEVGGDAVVTGMDAGMRTPPGISPLIGTNEIIVYDEGQLKTALANAAYTTIYLGADITMSTAPSTTNVSVAARSGPLVINGVDPNNPEGGKHTYTDYPSNVSYTSLRGACADITFKDINVSINNYYGIYRSTGSSTIVTFDGVEGKATQFYYGEGSGSTLIIKDSNLTLFKLYFPSQELVQNSGTVRFEGNVTVIRDLSAYTADEFFNLTGSASTVEIADGADVLLDNGANIASGNIFYGVGNFTVGRDARFTCISASGFCEPGQPLTNVTCKQNADVRFICIKSHTLSSLYGGTASTFKMEPGSSFLLYDHEVESSFGVCYFKNIILDNPESFIIMNSYARAIGSVYRPILTASGVSSIRYYPSAQIASVFDSGTYAYTPTRNYTSWWAQSSPFNLTANTWSDSFPTISTDYSSANVPASTTTVRTSLAADNFTASSGVFGIEIYGTVCTVTYDSNSADSGTAPASDAGVPKDLITVQGNTGSLARTGYTFAGWNTAPDGTGTPYSEGDTFAVTEDTTLYAQWTQNGCTVSGTLSGGSVGGLAVSYTINGGSIQSVTADADGYYAIPSAPRGSTVVITPPAQTGCMVNPANITLSSINADSTGNDFAYTRIYTVVERYVDESTGAVFQNDTYATPTAPPYSYGGSLDDITVNGDIYIYQGYKVGSYNAGDTPDGTGVPAISVPTAHETVYLIYHKVDGIINVTFQTGAGWDFYVDQDTYPRVETGTTSGSGGYYLFKNESDKPVYVDLTEVQETASGGLSLVADASASTPGSSEYSLQLLPAPMTLTGAVNGFTNTITGIIAGTHTTMRLGTLDGQYVRQAEPTSTNGYVTIGGYYAGHLSAVEKNPQLTLTFTFSLAAV